MSSLYQIEKRLAQEVGILEVGKAAQVDDQGKNQKRPLVPMLFDSQTEQVIGCRQEKQK